MPEPTLRAGVVLGTQPPFRRVRWMLAAARALRLDSAWIVDHFQGWVPRDLWDQSFTWLARPGSTPHAYYDWQVLMGRLAAAAGQVRLGIGVTEPIRRHPVLLAQAAMTVSHVTKRAPILGIGAGERENVEPYGLEFHRPVSRLEEALRIIGECFSATGGLQFRGEHFRLRGGPMDLMPAPGRVPEVWIAAHGPRMLDLCGRLGDGWYPVYPMTPVTYDAKFSVIRRAAQGAGRDPDAVTGAAQLFVVLGRDAADVRAKLDHPAVRFFALLASAEVWREWGHQHPYGPRYRGIVDFIPGEHDATDVRRAIAEVPVEAMEAAAIIGTPGDVLSRIRRLAEAGLQHAVLVPASAVVSPSDALWSLRQVLAMARRLQRGD